MKNLSRAVKFIYQSSSLDELATDVLILPLFSSGEEKIKLSKELEIFDKSLDNMIKRVLDAKDFIGKKNSTLLLHPSGIAKRIILAGLGEKQKISLEIVRAAISAAISSLKNISAAKAAIRLFDLDSFTPEELGQAVVEAAVLSLYEFSQYKKADEKKKASLKEIRILTDKDNLGAIRSGGEIGEKIARAVCLARDLANEPANIVTPATLANEAVKMAKQNGIKYKILEIKDMKRLGMGALLGVAKGSDEPAKFIILEYTPKEYKVSSIKYKDKRSGISTIVLVGKGITFDSGGISIKPSQSMDEMKYDMAGRRGTVG